MTPCLLLLVVAGPPAAATDAATGPASPWYEVPAPDQSDWSVARREGYAKSRSAELRVPVAVLSIPQLALAVPVFADTRMTTLEGGVGLVDGAAPPGTPGNLAIAGHRDSFFRPLERITSGTRIRLETDLETIHYAVSDITIVDALDTGPLDGTDETVLTLITCHPFRFKGYAPNRFIVRAELLERISEASGLGQARTAPQPIGTIFTTERITP
ncbi:MAG: class D sortase [Woeseiaceae bacterium]|nr:class D sortase [Woeseiaceae bacterium]